MKLLLFLLLSGMYLFSYGQKDSSAKQKIYKVSLRQTTSKISLGLLAAIEDSAISLAYKTPAGTGLDKIYYNNIQQLSIKRKGSVGRGILYGTLIGFGAGAISGLIIGGDPPCNDDPQNIFYGLCDAFRTTAGEKAIALGSAGAVGGVIIGAIVGALAKKTFVIGGKKDKFDVMKLSVLDKMYGNRQIKNDYP